MALYGGIGPILMPVGWIRNGHVITSRFDAWSQSRDAKSGSYYVHVPEKWIREFASGNDVSP